MIVIIHVHACPSIERHSKVIYIIIILSDFYFQPSLRKKQITFQEEAPPGPFNSSYVTARNAKNIFIMIRNLKIERYYSDSCVFEADSAGHEKLVVTVEYINQLSINDTTGPNIYKEVIYAK